MGGTWTDASQRERFFISHHHVVVVVASDEAERDFPTSDAGSLASVVIHKPTLHLSPAHIPWFVVTSLRELAAKVVVSTAIRRYILDIVVFLRMHRAVKAGVTAAATVEFEALVRCLAPLHDYDFVTPALVQLAVFKIYGHRIVLVEKAEEERSVLWGSEKKAVEKYLGMVDVEAVVEDVVACVRAPV